MLTRWTWRLVRWAAAVALLLAVLVVGQEVWNSSSTVRDTVLVPTPRPPNPPVEVVAVEGDLLTLPRTPLTQTDGVWGIRWPGGYGQVRQLLVVGEDAVQRRFSGPSNPPPAGTLVTFDPYAYPAEPGAVRGAPIEDVVIEGPLGDYPAQFIAGESDVWVLAIHGRGQDGRRQVARILPTIQQLGMPVLIVGYRNDPGAPQAPDGFYRWGLEEWHDIEAALAYASVNGADEVVLYGWGMGGTIAATFVHETELRVRVKGLILDSAVLDLGAYVDASLDRQGLSRYVDEAGKALAAMRFSLNWSALDQVRRAAEFNVPVLLMHGSSDPRSPVEDADALAASRPDVITYERFPNAGSDSLWNTDPVRYERAVESFLTMLLQEEPAQP